jgi:hypothetical protein
MKRVRLASAAALAPALGLAFCTPAALAATDHHQPGSSTTRAPGKMVRLPTPSHRATPAAAAAEICSYGHFKDGTTGHLGIFHVSADWNGGTLCYVHGSIPKSQTGLTMRARVYKGPGAKNGIFSNANIHGHIYTVPTIETVFSASFGAPGGAPGLAGGTVVCLALVNSHNHNSVKYGPVCLNY